MGMRVLLEQNPRNRPVHPDVATALQWRVLLIVIPLVVLATYTATFINRPIVLSKADVVADADAPMFARLLREATPARVFGVADREIGRHSGDVTQEHKVKHPLFAMEGREVWRA